MPLDFEELQKRKRPSSATCEVVLDSTVAEAWEEARTACDQARSRAGTATASGPEAVAEAEGELADAEDALKAAEKALRKATATFRMEALAPTEYDALLDVHQPTEDQRRQARKKGDVVAYNPDTFKPALLAACCVDPPYGEDQWAQLWKSGQWSRAELDALFYTALGVNVVRHTPDLGKGSGRIST